MKRSSCRLGKRGTSPGRSRVGTTPLQAICSVIQTGLGPAAVLSVFVTSPTTLRSRLSVPTVVAGRIRDRVDVGARDVARGPVRRQLGGRAAGRVGDHERMVRVERLDALVAADEPRRPDPAVAPKRGFAARRPLSRRRAPAWPLSALTTFTSNCSRGPGVLPARQISKVAEPDPAEETVRGGCVELRALLRDLPVRRTPCSSPRCRCERCSRRRQRPRRARSRRRVSPGRRAAHSRARSGTACARR